MKRSLHYSIATAFLGMTSLCTSATATAQTVMCSNFTAGDEGWTVGAFTSLSSTSALTFDGGSGVIETGDVDGCNGLKNI